MFEGVSMGRSRVPKSNLLKNRREKVACVCKSLNYNFTDNEFISMFSIMYPEDWDSINVRYKRHVQLKCSNSS